MEKLFFENQICLYINHQQLITETYRKYTKDSNYYYALKPALFNFKPKENNCNNVAKSNSTETKTETNEKVIKKNRKRKTSSKITEVEKYQLHQLETVLEHIQVRFLQTYRNLDSITRLWEEDYDFPQFKGCNNTQQFQYTTFDAKNFIIPPLTRFFNYDAKCLTELIATSLSRYDLIIIDMPWQNKYIKRLKRVKRSLGYNMLSNEELKAMPIPQLMHPHALVALWCTNCKQHQDTLLDDILPTWNLQLVHTVKWFKINVSGELISPLKGSNHKQPYEMLYIACHNDRDQKEFEDLKKINYILSVPSIIHSHKPPLYEWLKDFLPNQKKNECLEVFARYLYPHFTSIGLEVLKLMDKRLYNKVNL